MMQVSNFAGPKMGGPKNSDCWNTWQLIYTSVLPKMVPPQFLSCRQSDTLDVVFLKTWRQYPRFLFKAELVQDRDCPYGAIQASPQELIQLVAQLPSASQEAKQQGFPRSWSKADGAAPEVFFFFYWKQQQWISMKHPQKPGVFLVAIPVDQEISRDIWMIYIYICTHIIIYIIEYTDCQRWGKRYSMDLGITGGNPLFLVAENLYLQGFVDVLSAPFFGKKLHKGPKDHADHQHAKNNHQTCFLLKVAALEATSAFLQQWQTASDQPVKC